MYSYKNVQKMWENYLFRKYLPFMDSFDKILYEKYHKHSIKHLHTHSPYKAANNTRRGYVIQKGSTKSRTALNTKATLLIINASTLVTSAITPDKIRPTVLVIPENEIKI